MKSMPYFARLVVIAGLSAILPLSAGAAVRKEGTWPAAERKIDLDFEGKPSEGLEKLAHEAGWSIVVSKAIETDAHDVRIAVEGQPADAILDALFADKDVVARRAGTLVSIVPASSQGALVAVPGVAIAPAVSVGPGVPGGPVLPAMPGGFAVPAVPADPAMPVAPTVPAIPVMPAIPAMPAERGEDRNVLGKSMTVGKNEIVHTVSVTGGSARIDGTVTGDLIVAGGSARLGHSAHVFGNVTVFGGSVRVASGATIEGDVGVVGGSLHRDEGAVIRGRIVDGAEQHGSVGTPANDTSVEPSADRPSPQRARRARIAEAVQGFGESVTKMALIFVFGCVLLALLTGRMEKLRVEIASRPMRSLALGLVGTLAGAVVGTIALAVLCVTVIGIPIAVMAVCTLVFAVYAAFTAVLTTFGAAVIGHKTANPYLHLLFGCAVFLVASSLPWIGGLVTFGVTMIAIGVLVSTKMAGFLERRSARLNASGLV